MMRAGGVITRSVLGAHEAGGGRAGATALFKPTPSDQLSLRSAVRAWGVPQFRNWPLLLRALTHSSLSNWAAARLAVPPASLGQAQLEFLGDRVISAAVVAESCHGIRNVIGNRGFAIAAKHAGVARLLRCPRKYVGLASVLADAYEAVAGAIYLDGGIVAARMFVRTTLLPLEADLRVANKDVNRLRVELGAAVAAKLRPGGSVSREEYAVVEGLVISDLQGGGDRTYGHRLLVHGESRRDERVGSDDPWVLADFQSTTRIGAEVGAIEEALVTLQAERVHDASGIIPREPPGGPGQRRRGHRRHDRLVLATSSVFKSTSAILNSSCVNACLVESGGKLDAPVSGDAIAATLDAWMRSVFSREATELLKAIANACEIGHRVYWLCLAEAAFRAAPNAPRPDLQEKLITFHARRYELARCMGGCGASGEGILVFKPHRRMMLFVALGVVEREHGFEAALRWVEGGRKLLTKEGQMAWRV